MTNSYNLQKMSTDELKFLARDPATYKGLLLDPEALRRGTTLSTHTHPGYFSSSATTSLGKFSKLPLEVLHMVFGFLPVRACNQFLQTNSTAYHIMTSWPTLLIVQQCGIDLVRAVIAVNLDWMWTYSHLVSAIFSTKCEVCQEHGEIIYCFKMVRCCFHCLSTDRRLLAVSLAYAEDSMGVLKSSKHQSLTRAIYQPENWDNYYAQQLLFGVDYTAAVQLSTSTYTQRFQTPPDNPQQPKPEKLKFDENWSDATTMVTSIRAKPLFSIQQRRSIFNPLPQLFIPSYITNPPEGQQMQYQYSVYLPAKTKYYDQVPYYPRRGRPAGLYKTLLRTIDHNAQGCAGCAHYWNYHSPLPGEYHTVYDIGTDLHDLSSDFMHHLKYCIYARMYWNKLYPSSNAQLPSFKGHASYQQMVFSLKEQDCLRFCRSGHSSQTTRNLLFELLTPRALSTYATYADNDPSQFTPPTIWPAKPSSFPRTHPTLQISPTGEPSYTTSSGAVHKPKSITIPAVLNTPLTPSSPTWPTDPISPLLPQPDEYADMLFTSTLPQSQAIWATANFYNPYDLLCGPLALLRMKAEREKKRICEEYRLKPDAEDAEGAYDRQVLKREMYMFPDFDGEEQGYDVGSGKGVVLEWFC